MFGCDRVFYHPNNFRYGDPSELQLDFESVCFPTTDDFSLHGWFFPARGNARGTVLHLHGNAGNITGHFLHIVRFPPAGWNVLTFDYRGYGRSEGRMSREGSIRDAHAALDYLLSRPDVDARGIVAFGQSLGGAIGIVLTAERPEIRGLASDGAFDDYRRAAAFHVRRSPLLRPLAWWFPPLMIHKGCDPIDYVGKISPRPLLILHGTADRVVDPMMARTLHAAAGEPKTLWMVDGADHYETLTEDASPGFPGLLRFYESCVELPIDRQVRSETGAEDGRR